MTDIWVLCKKDNKKFTAIGMNTTEQAVKDMAQDGDYLAIPVTLGHLYDNIVDLNMILSVSFSSTSQHTIIQLIETQLQEINANIANVEKRLDTLEKKN